MDLARLGWLSEDQALRYLHRLEPRLSMEDPRIGMDLDPQALSSGSATHPGVLLLAGGRVDALATPPDGASSVFVEGDLHIEGCLVSLGHLLVTGNLTAGAVYTQHYLVVMGDLRVGRFLGVDDGYGTRVVGDLTADDVVGYRNHHLSLFGTLSCRTYVDDGEDGEDAVIDVLARWGVPRSDHADLETAVTVLRS